MNNETENPDEPVDKARELALDELLRSALWPDEASDPLNHLLRKAEWPEPEISPLPDVRRIVRRNRRKRTLLALCATAAAVLLAMVAIWNAREATKQHANTDTKVVSGDNRQAVSPQLPSREERLQAILQQVRARTTADEEEIDCLIARRVAEPQGDLEDLARPLMPRQAEYEQRLLARIKTLVGEREAAAVELLGELGSNASLPLLRRERLKPLTHTVAVRALIQLADYRTLARLERQEWDDDLREEIAAELRSRRDTQTPVSTLFSDGDEPCPERQLDFWPHAGLF